MRRRVIIASFAIATALCIGLIAYLRPPPPDGTFPLQFSDAEKRQVVSAANSDAIRQTLRAIGHGQCSEARRWILNSRRQTVRSIGRQGEGKVHVDFGVDDPNESDGYFIWARYIMKNENGRWVVDGPLF